MNENLIYFFHYWIYILLIIIWNFIIINIKIF
nr:MAG TPA: hypothetical protein [Bacteriophage sp.]